MPEQGVCQIAGFRTDPRPSRPIGGAIHRSPAAIDRPKYGQIAANPAESFGNTDTNRQNLVAMIRPMKRLARSAARRNRTGAVNMLFTRFVRNRDGGAAPLLALAVLPMLAATGAAIDYSRANTTKAALQAALDATGLMLSQEAATLSTDDLGAKANVYFKSLFSRPEAQNISISHQFTSPQQGSFSLKLAAQAEVPMIFASILGQSQIAVGVTSEILWGIKRLNLALALDNTGSMGSNGKMSALKTAAHNLLNTLQAAEKVPGDIKVSIIPFATDVNAGTQNVNAAWIDWTEWDAKNGTCTKSGSSQSSCLNNGGVWTPKSHSTWNGCVWDRDQNHDVQNTAAGSSVATKFRAHQASNCPTAMMPLSQDWSALHHDAGRKHQRHDRHGLGLANLVARRTDECPGTRARSRQGHHPFDRRPEHAEPLDHIDLLDRCPHAEGLRQRQGRQHQGLYGARDRRQRHAAEELRDQAGHVLRRRPSRPAQCRLQVDRAKPRQSADRKIDRADRVNEAQTETRDFDASALPLFTLAAQIRMLNGH
jgi:Flp pilus assembly protein TadG